MPDTLCADLLEAYQEAYEEWKAAEIAASEASEDFLMAVAAAKITCTGAVITVETIVGGVVGGAACLAAQWNMHDKFHDWKRAVEERNRKRREMILAYNEYVFCINDHKNDDKLPG